MSVEAMKQALEALEYLQGIVDTERGPKAAEALRQAIATEESSATQKPVAWLYKDEPYFDGKKWRDQYEVTTAKDVAEWHDRNCKPLYTHPQPKAEQEPVTAEEKRNRMLTELAYMREQQEPKCNPHPKAPHGFNRNASHANDRYVCECEGWDAYEAGYEAGYKNGMEDA